jgi:hypothetical protein
MIEIVQDVRTARFCHGCAAQLSKDCQNSEALSAPAKFDFESIRKILAALAKIGMGLCEDFGPY